MTISHAARRFLRSGLMENRISMSKWRPICGEGHAMGTLLFSARDLVGKVIPRLVIPRLWIRQLEESEARFLKEYLAGRRALNGRYLDIW